MSRSCLSGVSCGDLPVDVRKRYRTKVDANGTIVNFVRHGVGLCERGVV